MKTYEESWGKRIISHSQSFQGRDNEVIALNLIRGKNPMQAKIFAQCKCADF